MATADELVPHLQDASSLPTLSLAELRARIFRLEAGDRLVLAGIGHEGLRSVLEASDEAVRSLLVLANDGLRTTEAVLDKLLDDLADVALAQWPWWNGGEVGAGSHGPWLKAAAKHAAAGRRPRLRRAAKSLEFAQLLSAINPVTLVLVADVDPASPVRAAPVIEALEWCVRHGAAVVTLFSTVPPHVPPYDRVLYGAYEVILHIQEASGATRDERRFFTRNAAVAAIGEPIFFAYAGLLGEDRRDAPLATTRIPFYQGGVARRFTPHLALDATVMGTDRTALLEIGGYWLARTAQLRVAPRGSVRGVAGGVVDAR